MSTSLRRLLKIAEVKEITGFGHAYLYELIALNQFVRPVKIGRASRWPSDEVQNWIDQRVAARDAAN